MHITAERESNTADYQCRERERERERRGGWKVDRRKIESRCEVDRKKIKDG